MFALWVLNQIGHGSRGDIKILPTLVINNRQYRGTKLTFEQTLMPPSRFTRNSLVIWSNFYRLSGKLERRAVLKAICSGFRETTEPAICLNGGGLLCTWQIQLLGFLQRTIDILTSWVRFLAKMVSEVVLSSTIFLQIYRQISVWTTMVVAGKTRPPMLLHAGYCSGA